VFNGQANGVPYRRISPNTTGDVSWSAGVGSTDRGASSGVNAINRDLIFSRNARTLNHRVANGRWEVLVTRAEGQVVVGGVNTAAGQFRNRTFQVDVTDGELNLEFSDNGGSNREWTATRVLLNRCSIELVTLVAAEPAVAEPAVA